MDFRHFKLLVVLVLAERIWSLPVVCRYNGTSYKEGESLRMGEPCLSCVCRTGGLACSLRVCPDYLETLPAGCFLVHKPDDCCPRLLCEGGFNQNGIEFRTVNKTGNNGKGCLLNGTIYGEGSAVASPDPCEYCYCSDGGLRCVRPRCLRTLEGCKAIDEDLSCCPTRFDCRGMKISFLTSRVKNREIQKLLRGESEGIPSRTPKSLSMASSSYTTIRASRLTPTGPEENDGSSGDSASRNFNLENPLEPLRSLGELKGKGKPYRTKQSNDSLLLKEKITKNFATATTTEQTTTEETTFGVQMETTVSSTPDCTTTLSFQASDAGNTVKEYTVEFTEKTTLEVTTVVPRFSEAEDSTQDVEGSEEWAEEPIGDRGRSPVEATEAVGSRWNSSLGLDDYDSYDYAEPKLPPSLPNLVIFPFVAADAVVKDGNVELYKETQIKRIDGRPIAYKDYFSPPPKTEGGFIPKQTPSGSFYEFPFIMKVPTLPHVEEQIRAPQINTVPRTPNEPSFSSNGDKNKEFLSEGILKSNSEKFPHPSDPSKGVAPIVASGMLINSQHTKKPVTVAYKNVVVDFYPDRLVTTTRNRFMTQTAANSETEDFHLNLNHSIKSHLTTLSPDVSLRTAPEPDFDFFNKTIPSFLLSTERGLLKETASFAERETASTTTTKEFLFFQDFIKTFLMETNSPTVTAFMSDTDHKYSSKINYSVNEKAGSKVENGTAVVGSIKEAGTTASLTDGHPFSGFFSVSKQPSFSNPTDLKNRHEGSQDADKLLESSGQGPEGLFNGEPFGSNYRPGTLLKLAGCNIYGMMYRIGKVITELSGPCMECLCTDIGVRCNPLRC